MRKASVILLVLLLALMAWLKAHKQRDVSKDIARSQEQGQAQTQEEDTTQKVQSFSISGFSENGKNKWQVKGESADIFSDVVNMNSIKAITYGEDVSVTLIADEGTFFKSTNDIELRKNVIANTDEGTSLKTDKLKWLASAERIVSDDYVYIKREDITVAGTGARAIPDMKRVWLNRDIQMTVSEKTTGAINDDKNISKAEPNTTITCDGPLEVDYQKNVSYFNKNVVIKDKEGSIFADKVIAYFDPKQKKIYKAVAKGNVKIIHKQNTSYSREAIYLANEGKVILVGRPKVVIYSVDKLLEDDKEGNKKQTGKSL